ncbi:hypothetical protein LCGC14_2985480, partial [marine sediment metagenome]
YMYMFEALTTEYSFGGSIFEFSYDLYYEEYVKAADKALAELDSMIEILGRKPEYMKDYESLYYKKRYENDRATINENKFLMKEGLDYFKENSEVSY